MERSSELRPHGSNATTGAGVWRQLTVTRWAFGVGDDGLLPDVLAGHSGSSSL